MCILVKKMKRYRVELTAAEREYLQGQIKEGKFRGMRLRRAHILLGADESEGGKRMTDVQIQQAYGGSIRGIEITRRRFVEEGFEVSLHGVPRPVNRKRKVDARVESRLIALRCSDAPEGSNGWTLRLLADKLVELGCVERISRQGVSDVLKKHQLSLGKSNHG